MSTYTFDMQSTATGWMVSWIGPYTQIDIPIDQCSRINAIITAVWTLLDQNKRKRIILRIDQSDCQMLQKALQSRYPGFIVSQINELLTLSTSTIIPRETYYIPKDNFTCHNAGMCP